MCTHYTSSSQPDIDSFWHIGRSDQWRGEMDIFPRALGPFVRAGQVAAGAGGSWWWGGGA